MKKTFLFFIFLAVGIQVLFIGGYYQAPAEQTRILIKVINVVVCFSAAYAFSRREDLRPYYPVALAFGLSALGFLLSFLLSDWTANLLNATPTTPRGVALLKVGEVIPMVLPALVLIPIWGEGFGSIYLQRGRLGVSLVLGVALGAILVVLLLLISDAGPKARSSLSFAGWMLLFAFSNAFMEELLVRGLFLRPFEKFFRPFIALLLTALLFTVMHFDASYLNAENFVTAVPYIFLLGLGTGAVIQRSGNLWGAVLAHAAADVVLIISTFGWVG
jgi:membrane protease YdiL (CAAX protease family)